MTDYVIRAAAELMLAVAVALWLRTFVAALTFVKGNSMCPTLKNGDVALVRMRRSRKKDICWGDVVICRYPGRGRKFFVKRVVGVPGDHVSRVSGVTLLNGESLDARANLHRGDYEHTLGEDEYFCVGDNRANSHDSRDWQRIGGNQVGPIRRDMIFGVVKYVIWPAKHRRKIDGEFAFQGVLPVTAPPEDEGDLDEYEQEVSA